MGGSPFFAFFCKFCVSTKNCKNVQKIDPSPADIPNLYILYPQNDHVQLLLELQKPGPDEHWRGPRFTIFDPLEKLGRRGSPPKKVKNRVFGGPPPVPPRDTKNCNFSFFDVFWRVFYKNWKILMPYNGQPHFFAFFCNFLSILAVFWRVCTEVQKSALFCGPWVDRWFFLGFCKTPVFRRCKKRVFWQFFHF